MDKYGVVKLSNILSLEESNQLIKWADSLNQIEETPGKWMIYFESNGNRARIENFLSFNSDIKQFVDNKLQPLLEDIINQKVCLFKDKMNWKHGYGKGFAPHQDHPAWSDFTPSKYYTIAVFADNTTLDNGCLEFTENNVQTILPYNKDGDGSLTDSNDFNWKPITTTPRDVIIFDSYAPHRSGDNKTKNSRRIFYFTYNLESEGYFYDDYIKNKRSEFPPRNERKPGNVYNTTGTKYNLANPLI